MASVAPFTCRPDWTVTLAELKDTCAQISLPPRVAEEVFRRLPVRCRGDLVYMQGRVGMQEICVHRPDLYWFCTYADTVIAWLMKRQDKDITSDEWLCSGCIDDFPEAWQSVTTSMLARVRANVELRRQRIEELALRNADSGN